MLEKKERSPAQRAADARYAATHKNANKTITFIFRADEAAAIETAIAATGLSKADFLRQAVKKF